MVLPARSLSVSDTMGHDELNDGVAEGWDDAVDQAGATDPRLRRSRRRDDCTSRRGPSNPACRNGDDAEVVTGAAGFRPSSEACTWPATPLVSARAGEAGPWTCARCRSYLLGVEGSPRDETSKGWTSAART
jgi:hypothetical protein